MYDLHQAHVALHETFDGLCLALLEALMALDLEEAQTILGRLTAALTAHASVEEAEVLAHWRPRPDPPRGASAELFERDHALLLGALAAARASLEALAAPLDSDAEPLSRRVARELGTFLRVRSVLEHHSERELRFLYPTLQAELDEGIRATLGDALEEARAQTLDAPIRGA